MDATKFIAWLQAQGAEVLARTNSWEVARFRARGAVHVIYRNRRGHITAPGFAGQCLEAFEAGASLGMGFRLHDRTPMARIKHALLERDGDGCFFCARPMTAQDMSVEHLVALAKGGPNHMDNLALAHEACNKKADNLPLAAKINIRLAALRHLETGR